MRLRRDFGVIPVKTARIATVSSSCKYSLGFLGTAGALSEAAASDRATSRRSS